MGSGFSKMKKQARLLQQQYEGLKSKEVEGTSGNGLVTVIVNGEKELLKITIKPDCVDKSDIDGLQDLIKAACQDAYQKINADQPAMGLPF